MTDFIKIKAPAKVNIALDIVGKRDDGYHEMRMINHSLNLYDQLTITKSDAITLSCNDGRVPLNEKNIVYKAVKRLREYTGKDFGADIYIEKNIPMEAGLAGGSADAAAALKGLNVLYDLNLTIEQLIEVGVQCGADVPYCLTGGFALVEGIGEKLTPIAPLPKYHVLIVKPAIDIATPRAFGLADQCKNLTHPNIDAAVAHIEAGEFDQAAKEYGNSFESVIFPIYPEIPRIKKVLYDQGALYVTMTGSGSTVIAYFKDLVSALAAQKDYEQEMFAGVAELE